MLAHTIPPHPAAQASHRPPNTRAHCRTQLARALATILAGLFASTALAAPSTGGPQGIPSPANSTGPAHVVLVGTSAGVPDPAGAFTVTVRDLSNNPIAGIWVDFDVQGQPDLRLATTQPHPGVESISCSRVRALTNAAGVASFIVVGSAASRYEAGLVIGTAQITAGGIVIGAPPVAAYDQDGANGVGADDFSAWLCDFGSGSDPTRSDLDGTGGVGVSDLALLLVRIASENSSESSVGCALGTPVPDQLLSGGLSLGWGDCRNSSNVDQFFACNANSGNYHMVVGLESPFDIADASALEVVIDVENPAGPLPAWWQFSGCRSAGLSTTDPNIDPALTCATLGVGQVGAVSAAYPYLGNPNIERITGVFDIEAGGLISANSHTAIADLVLSRARTVGPGACADCNVPVVITLRSVRVVRGAACTVPAANRPAAVVFTQPAGSTIRWQSATPGFPITVDATPLGPGIDVRVNNTLCTPNTTPLALTLQQGQNFVRICSSSCNSDLLASLPFGVDANGNVFYDPSSEGALTGAGTPTLVVHSAQFPPPGDDTAPSLGVFRVVVEPQFWSMLAGYPGFAVVNGLHRLVSPTVYDPNTVIGRSSMITHGSPQDLGGVPVGSAGTVVSDAMFTAEPPGFQGPNGTAEIHTQIAGLNMTNGLVAIRAGSHAPTRPNSIGEIESVPGGTGLFPADSFFDVYVEVDLPNLEGLLSTTTFYNSDPLLVENSGVNCFPPRLVYQHRHTGPVQLRFKNNDTQLPARWAAGDPFGWLVLAGHGINWDTVTTVPARGRASGQRILNDPVAEFLAIANAEPEMADTATLVVDLNDALSFAPPGDFIAPQYRDSLTLGIAHIAFLGNAGNPCGALVEADRLYTRVDSVGSFPDWITTPALRRTVALRLQALILQLTAQSNQTGGCPVGVTPEAPKVFALLGVHPNPTSGNAVIRYALPTPGHVSLEVYDVSGRHVRTLVQADLPAGSYQAVWDGHQDRASGRLAQSGTYFLKLTANGRVDTRRLVRTN